MVNIKLNNQDISVESGITILEAAKQNHIDIPHLCNHPNQEIKGNCRICMVQTGDDKLEAACSTKVKEGMNIKTNTRLVREIQKGVLELMLANHKQDCLVCTRNGNCELQDLCERFNIPHNPLDTKIIDAKETDDNNPSIIRDYSKCIKCNRCVEACNKLQGVNILSRANRSTSYEVVPKFDHLLGETECVYCGQCINVCPVGAIYEKSSIDLVLDVLEDEDIHTVVQIAPAIRVSIGEEFGYDPGTITTGKLVTSLRQLGFNSVFDTDFTADLTILEEGHELLDRITNGGVLPMITSCSPGWINYVEGFYPELIPHLSTCKSPQQMFGALSKSYYAEKIDLHPSKIFTVSVMPCTAKKFEAQRPEMNTYGNTDVDVVLTTRELAKLIKKAGIKYTELKSGKFDDPFGITTGAAVIFGATGGVMEAALRTVYEVVTKEELENIDFEFARGLDGIKEAVIDLKGTKVKVGIAHGLSNAKLILEEIKSGKSDYAFIEVMACPGGCIGGGGQPISTDKNIKEKRIRGIYSADKNSIIRKSHKNPAVAKLYEDFLIKPLGHKSHELLHTHYHARKL